MNKIMVALMLCAASLTAAAQSGHDLQDDELHGAVKRIDAKMYEARYGLDDQLEKGDHEITLTSLREEAVLDYLALQAQEKLPSYEEYKAANAGLPAVQGVEMILQAENALSSWATSCTRKASSA